MTDHSKDVLIVHDAVTAGLELLSSISGSDLSHTDWLETIRGVRQKVQTFALFVPNAERIEHALDTAEKVVLGLQAMQRITSTMGLAAKSKDGVSMFSGLAGPTLK